PPVVGDVGAGAGPGRDVAVGAALRGPGVARRGRRVEFQADLHLDLVAPLRQPLGDAAVAHVVGDGVRRDRERRYRRHHALDAAVLLLRDRTGRDAHGLPDRQLFTHRVLEVDQGDERVVLGARVDLGQALPAGDEAPLGRRQFQDAAGVLAADLVTFLQAPP